MALIGLVGAGGFGKEVMPLVREYAEAQARAGHRHDLRFVDTSAGGGEVIGEKLIAESEFLAAPGERLFNIAIRSSRARERLSTAYEEAGAKPLSIISRHAIRYTPSEAGPGLIACAFSIIEASARIGRYFHCHMYSYVAHDCRIGDFVTFGPNVHCNGNVEIGDHAYIGAGAMLRDGTASRPLRIGAGAVVGMGAVVVRDVEPGTVVAGNPARFLRKA